MSQQNKSLEKPELEEKTIGGEVRCQGVNYYNRQCKYAAINGSDYCRYHQSQADRIVYVPPRKEYTRKPREPREPRPRAPRGYVPWIPTSIAGRYQEILEDEDLISLRSEIALLKVRMTELLEQLDEGENPLAWKALVEKWALFMGAVRDGNTDRQTKLLYELDGLITGKPDVHGNWTEMTRLTENVRKLVQTEVEIEMKRESLMSVEKVLALIAMLFSEWTRAIYAHAPPDSAKRIIVEVDAKSRKLIGNGESSG